MGHTGSIQAACSSASGWSSSRRRMLIQVVMGVDHREARCFYGGGFYHQPGLGAEVGQFHAAKFT